jgi:hypothetical protein
MAPFYLVTALSIISWVFTAIRQQRSNLFFYFYILALMDPCGLLFSKFGLNITPAFRTTTIMALMIVVVFYYTFSKRKYFYFALFFSIILTPLILFSNRDFCYIIFIVTNVFVLFFFTRRTLLFVVKSSKVNIFHVVLVLYEISLIMKMLSFLTDHDLEQAVLYFAIANIFQIFIAIFFTIYLEDNSKLHIPLKTSLQEM